MASVSRKLRPIIGKDFVNPADNCACVFDSFSAIIYVRNLQQTGKRGTMHKQTISINGKTYDAVSGELINQHTASPNTSEATASLAQNKQAAPASAAPNKLVSHTRQPKPSQTLMRTAVKKPEAKSYHKIRVQTAVNSSASDLSLLSAKQHAARNTTRSKRSAATRRVTGISRFASTAITTDVPASVQPIPVRAAPPLPPAFDFTPKSSAPVAQRNDDMFMQAIANANHHVDIKANTREHKRHATFHFASMMTGVAALLLIVGFAVAINSSGIQLKLAGFQAGLSAANPDFSKTGFSYTGVTTSHTKRTINLKSNERSYQLIQQATSWSADQMIHSISSVSANGSPNYQTVYIGDQPVYRLDNGNATWVKNGTWYQLNGDRAVDVNQLTALVQNS